MQERAVAVLAPAVFVSVTIEAAAGDADDIHVHAGGQGVWVARMLRQLDARPVVCAPVGGETGRTLLGLVGAWGIELRRVETIASTPAYVHDRRGGERVEVARSEPPTLHRHEVDELYNRFLELALSTGRCVVTGPAAEGLVPDELYRRLGADLAAAGIEVVADLHGASLDRLLEGGPVDVLKVGVGDLIDDGALAEAEGRGPRAEEAIGRVATELTGRGARTVVVSRGGEPILAWSPEGAFRVSGPALEVVDGRGSGDSMTAALTAALIGGQSTERMLATAWAAGAANVTRRGLGSGIPGLVAELTERAVVERRGDRS